MKNINNQISIQNIIKVPFETFKNIIETQTDSLKTAVHHNTVYIIHSEKAELSDIYNNQTAIEILSDYFDATITEWHTDRHK